MKPGKKAAKQRLTRAATGLGCLKIWTILLIATSPIRRKSTSVGWLAGV